MSTYRLSVVLRALAAGALALGSKSAAVAKGAGGLKTIVGMTAAGGAVAAVASTSDAPAPAPAAPVIPKYAVKAN